MTFMTPKYFYFFIALSFVCILSCSDDEVGLKIGNTEFAFQNGFFIVNEGPLTNGSGSLSYYDRHGEETALENGTAISKSFEVPSGCSDLAIDQSGDLLNTIDVGVISNGFAFE